MTLPVAPAVTSAITVTQVALAKPGAFARGSSAWQAALVDMGEVQTALESVISTADEQLAPVANGVDGLPGILGATRASVGISNLALFTTASGDLAGALQQQGYINRAAYNLQNTSS